MGETDICLTVDSLSKKFSRSLKRSLIYGACDIGRTLVGRADQPFLRSSEFWALKGVSFQLRRGRSIGVIGPNGSGKTTLMRIIAGVLRPTLGRAAVKGRIAPMLALGAGFKPILSGRENIVLNLSLLGVPFRDIAERIEPIVAFAEIGEAIDAPIGTYSSGMIARLGFACAVHTEPQLLIVDEVLSVGDTKFKRKCRNHINALRRAGASMLLVSHSAVTIQALADECVYLRNGSVAAKGSPAQVLREYESEVFRTTNLDRTTSPQEASIQSHENDKQTAQIRSIQFQCDQCGPANVLLNGQSGYMKLIVDCEESLSDVSINVMVIDMTHQIGETVLFMASYRDIGRMRLSAGPQEVCLRLPSVGLRPAEYRVKVSISQGELHDVIDSVDSVRLLVRGDADSLIGLYFQPHEWAVNSVVMQPVLSQDGYEEINLIEEI